MTPAEPPRRILAVKLADLGDVLLCEPALRSLRAAWPDSRIDALIPPGSAQLVTLLDKSLSTVVFPKQIFDSAAGALQPRSLLRAALLAARLRRARYDVVVLFHHLTTAAGARKFRWLALATGTRRVVGLDNGRGTFLSERVLDRGFGALHEAEYMLAVARQAGGASVDTTPRFPASAVDRSRVPAAPYAVIYPATGGYAPARTWCAECYAAVARWLEGQGVTPVIVGGPDATPAAETICLAAPEAIDLTGQTSLAQTAGVVADAEVVIGGDSFVGHLAAALDRPLVAIFGPSNWDAWRPYSAGPIDTGSSSVRRAVLVRHPLPCEPCIYTGYSLGRPSGCPARTCLKLITVEQVIAATRHALEAA